MSLRYSLLAALVLVPAIAAAQPDLTVTRLSVEPDAVATGELVSVGYTLCDLGTAGVPDPIVGFFLSEDATYSGLDDRFIRDHAAGALAPGACADEGLVLTVPLDVEPGDYALFAVADPDDALAELDEGNNVRGVRLTVEGVVAPPIDVALNPVDPPIIIPDGGGSFAFEVLVASLSTTTETFDAWAEVIRPGGTIFRHPRLGPFRLTLTPGAVFGPVTLRLRVPAGVPPGAYLFRVSAGTFPSDPIDAESFEVDVLEGPVRTAAPTTDWIVEQIAGPPLTGLSAEGAEGVALPEVSPNPASGTTTVSFTLAEAAAVRLRVYDALGRVVLTLPTQALEAGPHALRLDVGSLPAGAYLVRFETGGEVHTRALTLVR